MKTLLDMSAILGPFLCSLLLRSSQSVIFCSSALANVHISVICNELKEVLPLLESQSIRFSDLQISLDKVPKHSWLTRKPYQREYMEIDLQISDPPEKFTFDIESVTIGIVKFDMTVSGSIHRNYDLLLRHTLHILGEVKYAVQHCLLANHGVKVEDLKRVLSHPQALAQCEHTLTSLGLVREAVDDTAGAAKNVAPHQLNDAGAVASSAAAAIYGLDTLAEDIQDDSDNVTRFLMLAREPIIPGTDRPFKTSIVFSLEEGPGVLFKALAVFALRKINLIKLN
ncbi:arogenate dehydratase 2-like [Euphorbia lathyris]|uniref:arogenate dehydratase 2-like n=1 Tax=Euphorbia lathyris TaxID=212925 RepID=UPI0033140CC6